MTRIILLCVMMISPFLIAAPAPKAIAKPSMKDVARRWFLEWSSGKCVYDLRSDGTLSLFPGGMEVLGSWTMKDGVLDTKAGETGWVMRVIRVTEDVVDCESGDPPYTFGVRMKRLK